MSKDPGLRPEAGVLETSSEAEARAFLEEQLRNSQYQLTTLAREADPLEVGRVKLDLANAQPGRE